MVCNNAKDFINKALDDLDCEKCEYESKCLEYSDYRKKAKCQEKGKTYSIENKSGDYKITLFRVDEGIIRGNDLCKCDYFYHFVKNKKNYIIFVELKGKDIIHACEQIYNTIRQLNIKNDIDEKNKVYGRIIYNGSVPKLYGSSPEYIRLNRLIKVLHGNLVLKKISFFESIEKIN